MDAYEEVRQQFQKHFNVHIPDFLGFSRKGHDLWSAHPDVLAQIEALWPTDEVQELLRNLMIPRLQESIGWMSFALPMQYYLVTYAALILVGVIIGLFGSAIAMRRYLRV